jgi:putative MATE family efflux protein
MTLAWNASYLIVSFGAWFAIAWSILVAQYFWAKNNKMVNKVAAQSMVAMVLTWLILSAILYFLAPHILAWMWAEWNLYDEALSYMKITFIALTFNFAFYMFQSIIRWVWEVKLPIYIITLCVVLNFIFDPLFIFGYGPFPELWVKWAALMTLLTQSIATVIWFTVLFKWNYWVKIKLKDYIPDWNMIKENFKLWFPSSIEAVSRNLWVTLMTVIVSYIWARLLIQSTLLSAYWAGGIITEVTILITIWLTQATAILVWQHAGSWNSQKAKKVLISGTKISFIIMTIIWIIVFITVPYIINIFIPNNPEVNYYWTQMIRTSCLFLGLVWIQVVWGWALRAIWHTKAPMYVTIISNLFIKLFFAYIFSSYVILWLNLWVKWIWWSEVVAIIISTLWMWYVLGKINWKHINITKKSS